MILQVNQKSTHDVYAHQVSRDSIHNEEITRAEACFCDGELWVAKAYISRFYIRMIYDKLFVIILHLLKKHQGATTTCQTFQNQNQLMGQAPQMALDLVHRKPATTVVISALIWWGNITQKMQHIPIPPVRVDLFGPKMAIQTTSFPIIAFSLCKFCSIYETRHLPIKLNM